ncbi:MAG: hypothetical protein ACOVNT_08400 [Flavobacterium macrobrachii]
MAALIGLYLGGATVDLLIDIVDRDGEFDTGEHLMNFGSELVPNYFNDFFGSKSPLELVMYQMC